MLGQAQCGAPDAEKFGGGASPAPVKSPPWKPLAATTWAAGSPPGARQLGEFFYVTMILPIRQGTACPDYCIILNARI